MPLDPCPDCEENVSSRAESCPRCGCPLTESDEIGGGRKGAWNAVLKSRTPINVFALAMMACASILGVSAVNLDTDALVGFTYTLHIFLAVSGMFFVCLIFCPRSMYHPDDLVRAQKEGVELERNRPVVAASLIGVMLVAYGLYQAIWG